MSAAPGHPQASSHPSAQHEGTAVSIDKLQGRWNIVSWTQDYDDGRVMKPMGDALEGFILYAPDGTMCCFIARADRPKFPSGLQFQASEAEKAQAYDGLMSYGGRYTVEGDRVEHHVEISGFPNWVGGVQKRSFRMDGDELLITARIEAGTPEARTATLRWRRAGA